MEIEISSTPLFFGIPPEKLSSLLSCLGAVRNQYKKGDLIFKEGSITEYLGIVLSGRVLMQYNDVWGTASILGSAGEGQIFGEAYACCPDETLQISAVAAEECTILFLNVNRILTTCPNSCSFHSTLIRNLLTLCAQKNLELSHRTLHTTPKTIRGRLLSYFSQCIKESQSYTFVLHYNRQQLADYLGVDRSAMCSELSKMQKDGLIQYHRSQITICQTDDLPFLS